MTSPSLIGAQLRRVGHAVTQSIADYVRHRPQARKRLALTVLAGAVPPALLTAFILAIPSEATIEPQKLQRVVRTPVRLPDLRHQITMTTPVNEPTHRDAQVRPNDTLASLFSRLGLRDPDAFAWIEDEPEARELVYPRRGGFVTANLTKEGRLSDLALYFEEPETGREMRLVVAREADGRLSARTAEQPLEVQTVLVNGRVAGSPEASLKDVSVPAGIIHQMHDAFDFDRDEVAKLVTGDAFRLIYEAKYVRGSFVRYGRLLAMSFDHDGRTKTWYWFNDDGLEGNFFDEEGRIAKRVFMRIPLDVKSVSSEFAPLRRHPITGVLRPHQGTDFRAPWGATVRAAADGEVVFAGVGTGYGNYIRLQHGPEYQTVYAHLSSIAPNVVKGAHVKYGQLIGRVGQTGLATGPHLHYELKVDGVQINPMTARLPDRPQLTPYQLAQMQVFMTPLKAKLQLLSRLQTPPGPTAAANAAR